LLSRVGKAKENRKDGQDWRGKSGFNCYKEK